MKRNEGYYWVKKEGREWPCLFNGRAWVILNEFKESVNDDYFDSINEIKILPPKEKYIYYTTESIPANMFVTLLPTGEMVPHTEQNIKRIAGERL